MASRSSRRARSRRQESRSSCRQGSWGTAQQLLDGGQTLGGVGVVARQAAAGFPAQPAAVRRAGQLPQIVAASSRQCRTKAPSRPWRRSHCAASGRSRPSSRTRSRSGTNAMPRGPYARYCSKSLSPIASRALRKGIANPQRAAAAVVTDHRLQMRVARVDRGEREGHAAIQQRLGAGLGDGELPRRPAVTLRPLPLVVGRGAVVANLVDNLQMVGRLDQKRLIADKVAGDARHVVLADEPHRKHDRPRRGPAGVLQPGGDGGEELAADLLGMTDRRRHVAQVVGHLRTLGGQPPAKGPVAQRRQLRAAIQGRAGPVVIVQLEQQAGELADDADALDVLRGFGKQLDRLGVTIQEREQVSGRLDGRTIPGSRVHCRPRGRQCPFITVFQLQHGRLAGANPGPLGRQGDRPLQPDVGSVEVAERRGQVGTQREPLRPPLGRAAVGRIARLVHKTPGGVGSARAGHVEGIVIAGLLVTRRCCHARRISHWLRTPPPTCPASRPAMSIASGPCQVPNGPTSCATRKACRNNPR